jgi:Ala-tRNA(Pro) deacylase
MNVCEFLKQNQVSFNLQKHPTTHSAQELAESLHVSGDRVAKSVVLAADGKYVLALLPASQYIDMVRARQSLAAKELKLAREDEIASLFRDCDLGSIPPFGSQYGLQTVVDSSFTGDQNIVFEGNHHDEAIVMSLREFERIEHPRTAHLSFAG